MRWWNAVLGGRVVTAMTRTCDLLVVGGGAGGLVAAREARRRGASTILVQDGRVGGDCTFTGCIPSKALLAGAARGSSFAEAMGSVTAAVERIAATEDATALARDGIEVVDGWAKVVAPMRWRSTVLASGGATSSSPPDLAPPSRPSRAWSKRPR